MLRCGFACGFVYKKMRQITIIQKQIDFNSIGYNRTNFDGWKGGFLIDFDLQMMTAVKCCILCFQNFENRDVEGSHAFGAT